MFAALQVGSVAIFPLFSPEKQGEMDAPAPLFAASVGLLTALRQAPLLPSAALVSGAGDRAGPRHPVGLTRIAATVRHTHDRGLGRDPMVRHGLAILRVKREGSGAIGVVRDRFCVQLVS
jgi:hypothetical protein